jgi:branched-chain amino acid transport system ATP-binding protein
MLQFENVSTFYGKIQALHGINVEVRQGEIVTLIGANGAGKSTLLMTLCGSPRAHSGSIRYMGEELVGQESAVIMRKSIAVVPEGRRVFARLTVEENLAMGGFFTGRLSRADGQGPGLVPAAQGALQPAGRDHVRR